MVNNIIVYHSTRSSYSTEVAESESEDNKEITGSTLVAEDLLPEAAEAESWFSGSLYSFNFSVADTKQGVSIR